MAQIERANPPAKKPLPVVVSAPSPLWQITRIVEPVGGAVFVLLLVVFMLIQQRELRARVVRLFGPDRLAETTRALDEASERISRYLLTQTALNASFGITIAVGLFVLGLPFALTWGVFGALLRFIPYAGAWVAAAIPVFVSLAVFDGWMEPLLIVGLFIVAETIIAFVLEPLFFARSAGVSSIALLISVAFWTWLWGPIGLALAIPLTVWLVVFSHTVKGLEFIGILVDDDARLDQHVIFYQRILAGDDQEAAELVREAVKTGSDLAAYDSILVPAMARVRRDYETGQLPPAEYAHVIETTRAVLDRAIGRGARAGDRRGLSGPRRSRPRRADDLESCPRAGRLQLADRVGGRPRLRDPRRRTGDESRVDFRQLTRGERAGASSREAATHRVPGDPDRHRLLGAPGLVQASRRSLRGGRGRRRDNLGPGAERPAALDARAGADARR